MNSLELSNATRVLATEQDEYNALHIVDMPFADGTPAMHSLWEPTPEELEKLNRGGKVRLTILGAVHPPVALTAHSIEELQATSEEPSDG